MPVHAAVAFGDRELAVGVGHVYTVLAEPDVRVVDLTAGVDELHAELDVVDPGVFHLDDRLAGAGDGRGRHRLRGADDVGAGAAVGAGRLRDDVGARSHARAGDDHAGVDRPRGHRGNGHGRAGDGGRKHRHAVLQQDAAAVLHRVEHDGVGRRVRAVQLVGRAVERAEQRRRTVRRQGRPQRQRLDLLLKFRDLRLLRGPVGCGQRAVDLPP